MQSTIAGLEGLRGNKKWTMMEANNVIALAADRETRAFNRTIREEGLEALFPGQNPTMKLPEVRVLARP
jgi:hypothetical protein